MRFHIESPDPVNRLQSCLDEISKRSMYHKAESPSLHFLFVDITPTILALLVQVLTQPVFQTPTGKWEAVTFHGCNFSREDTSTTEITADVNSYRFPDDGDRHLLGSTLARRVTSLALNKSPGILECLWRTPELETTCFGFVQDLFPEWLGSLILRSAHLKHLEMTLEHLKGPRMMMESLANATNLERLKFQQMIYHGQTRNYLADEIIRPGGNDIVCRLLQNPQSRLEVLTLSDMCLEDRHFVAIVDVLPTSRIKMLYVHSNNIQCRGILAFAAQLPRIKRLRLAVCHDNPWMNDREGSEQCWAALLKGLVANDSLEILSPGSVSQYDLEKFYLTLNWAGRRILATSNSVPLGLWPLILQRAGKAKDSYDKLRAARIFFFLQSGPLLSVIVEMAEAGRDTVDRRPWIRVRRKKKHSKQTTDRTSHNHLLI